MEMDVTTLATIFLNSSSLNNSSLSTTTTTTTSLVTPFLVTSMSHKTLHSFSRATSGSRHHIKDFSPVTLSTEWSSMARLLILSALSVVGSIGNVFMISSVMIEDHLKKAG